MGEEAFRERIISCDVGGIVLRQRLGDDQIYLGVVCDDTLVPEALAQLSVSDSRELIEVLSALLRGDL